MKKDKPNQTFQVNRHRRHFITCASGFSLLLLNPSLVQSQEVRPKKNNDKNLNDHILTAQGDKAERYSLSWINTQNKRVYSSQSTFRGHGLCAHPTKADSAILFSRRPGITGIEVDLTSGNIKRKFTCHQHHHMTGHGCFSADGQFLFTSENNYSTGKGKIIIRNADDYRIVDELDSGGIGPHEIKFLPNNKAIVVANGGILTHPKSGRKKLNLDSMQPNLTYIDTKNGKQLESVQFYEPKASIRHIDVNTDGKIAIAMQVQRDAVKHNNTIALCATHQLGEDIVPLAAPEKLYHYMNDYVGSVAINTYSQIAGFTSPRGDLAAFWHISNGKLAGFYKMHDVCGIAVSSDGAYFILSNSNGSIRYLNGYTLEENAALNQEFSGYQFDNHLIAMPIPATG